jgi:hypothetical protein
MGKPSISEFPEIYALAIFAANDSLFKNVFRQTQIYLALHFFHEQTFQVKLRP